MRKHVLRRAQAVHADNVCTGVNQGLGGLGRALPFCRGVLIFETDRDHHRQCSFLGALDCEQSFAQPGKSLADNEVRAFGHLYL